MELPGHHSPAPQDSDTLKFIQANTPISEASESLLNFCSFLSQSHTCLQRETTYLNMYKLDWKFF